MHLWRNYFPNCVIVNIYEPSVAKRKIAHISTLSLANGFNHAPNTLYYGYISISLQGQIHGAFLVQFSLSEAVTIANGIGRCWV